MFFDPDGNDNIPGTLDDNYRLSISSPAIDRAGLQWLPLDILDLDQDGLLWEMLPVDLDMNVRIFDGGSGTATVDIGAYEYGAPPVVLATEFGSELPNDKPNLFSNYPNPFSATTTVSYLLPSPSKVSIEVYDILGKRVRVLDEGFRAAGEHEIQVEAGDLSAGIYFLRMTAGEFSQTMKMVLMR